MTDSPFIFKVDVKHHRPWFQACARVAQNIPDDPQWRTRNFYGIVGDLKEKNAQDVQHYFSKRPGLAWKFAKLYLTEGIAQGEGYQSCAALAFSAFLTQQYLLDSSTFVCDIGTGIGTIPGALDLQNTHGFDRIPEFIEVCRQIDQQLGKPLNRYWCQDIFDPWETVDRYEHLMLGLVFHQFLHPIQITHFFTQAFSHLTDTGSLWITLPSNTIGSIPFFLNFITSVENSGFQAVLEHCGLIRSFDESESVFWMFVFRFQKKKMFPQEHFLFPSMETFKQKESRAHKRERIRLSVFSPTSVCHTRFIFYPTFLLRKYAGELNYNGIQKLSQIFPSSL